MLILLTAGGSCKPHRTDIGILVSGFADIECRAMRLRNSRFELANEIRFTEDTLMQTKNHSDSVRLKARLDSLNPEQEKIAELSRILADSIRINFDLLTKQHLANKEDTFNFNKQLNDTLRKRGCMVD